MSAASITAGLASKTAVMAKSVGEQLSERYSDVSLSDIGNYIHDLVPKLQTKEGREEIISDVKNFCEDNKELFKTAWADYKDWSSDGVGRGIRYASNPLVAFAVDTYDRYKETGEISLFDSVSEQDVEVAQATTDVSDSITDTEILKSDDKVVSNDTPEVSNDVEIEA